MKDVKSQFEKIVQEDFNQFREISIRFMNIQPDNVDELFQLSIDSWLLATRWSEIQSNASKMALDFDINKTDFKDYCYQKYRQLQELHVTTRSWYNNAVKDYELNRMIKGD